MGSSWGKMSLLTCFVVATKNKWTVVLSRMGVPGELGYSACWLFFLVVKIIWGRGGEELIQTWCGSVGLRYQRRMGVSVQTMLRS